MIAFGLILLVFFFIVVTALILIDVIRRDYDNRILCESKVIAKLREINSRYTFNDVKPLNLEHSYDNEAYYNIVSEKDYLIEKLTYISENVLKCITCAKENKSQYDAYLQEVRNVKGFGLETDFFFKNYANRREEILFVKEIEKPCIEFLITVSLYLTTLKGYRYGRKRTEFLVDEITNMINSIRDRDGSFYRDVSVWAAICRVERAKVSNKIRFSIYERDGYRCQKCHSSKNLEIDHIIPISKGGKSVYDNLQTLCHDCNSRKSNVIEKGVNTRYNRNAHICPNCEIELVLRDGPYGQFYGCPNYPRCKFTKNIR